MFNLSTIQITDGDLRKIEIRFGFNFNEGQKKLLRYWNTIDIQACPGSGKTTTLAAKLILLAEKLPASFSQGICVITHTNIAIEEIKAKLGSSAKMFFQYPNHFGTIQSFVDKFLAIPIYKNEFKHTPRIIDEFMYDKEIQNLYELKVSGTLSLLERRNIFAGGLSFNKYNFEVSKSVNELERFSLPKISEEKMDTHYKSILKGKEKLLAQGYLKYDEAYALAFKYIREHSSLLNAIRHRFPIVFIDEMQDMEQHQSEIISALFGPETIVQKIGDINQSIYSSRASDDTPQWVPVINPELALDHSNRLSNHLAERVKDICCSPQNMIGWDNENPIKPIIFVFDNQSILEVKDEFAKRVILNNLHTEGSVKVIGSRIGESRLNINSYWPDYNRSLKKTQFKNLVSYLADIENQVLTIRNVRDVRKQFLNCFCFCFKICKIKNPINQFYFTPFSFIKYLNDAGLEEKIIKIDTKISYWIQQIIKSEDIKCEVNILIQQMISFLNAQLNNELNTFLSDTLIEPSEELPENKIYKYSNNDQSVNLYFDTIHGVKGETHTATLYLETFTRVFDIGGKILNFIVADHAGKIRLRKDKACYKKLPHAYVAITRATHFFSMAVHKDRFLAEHRSYFDNKANEWDVVYL